MSKPTKKDREISRAWNRFNVWFRVGYQTADAGEPNPGNKDGTPQERGLHLGWTWRTEGKPCPPDPMWAVLDCDRAFRL